MFSFSLVKSRFVTSSQQLGFPEKYVEICENAFFPSWIENWLSCRTVLPCIKKREDVGTKKGDKANSRVLSGFVEVHDFFQLSGELKTGHVRCRKIKREEREERCCGAEEQALHNPGPTIIQ